MPKFSAASWLMVLPLLHVCRPAAGTHKVGLQLRPSLQTASRSQDNLFDDGEFWPLFPDGQVPGEVPGAVGPLRDGPPLANDPVGKKCAPGEHTGRWVYNVTVPGLVPRIVPPGQDGRTDAAVIVMPGGGYEFLAWTKEGLEVADWLNSLGISAFVLKYRVPERKHLPPLEQAAFMDAQRAFSLLRSKAASLGLNASRIGAIGFSAGAHLATVASSIMMRTYSTIDEVDAQPWQPSFQMLIYGSGLPHIGLKPGPSFGVITKNDPCAPVGEFLFYFTGLQADNITSEIHVFPDGGHGYGTCRTYPDQWYEVCAWPTMGKGFLEHEVLYKY